MKDITDLEAYINVKGALRYLLAAGDIRANSRVVIAGDLRPSTERIMRACVQAIFDSGCQVENAGRIPTPALVSHAITQQSAGVMVTGSHIPFDRNGIKINKSVGEVLKSDEAGIIGAVEHVRAEEYPRSATASLFDTGGMLKRAPELPPLDGAAEEAYVRRYVNCFDRGGLAGMRVLVYQHSAVGRDLLPRILRELAAAVVTAGRSHTFIPIDTENITDEQLARLDEFARSAEAGGRLIVPSSLPTAIPIGHWCRRATGPMKRLGAQTRALPARRFARSGGAEYLRADAAAVPISANDAVERRLGEGKITVEKTKIGSPYVVAALDDLRATGKHQRIVGWEANGGFLTGSDIELHGAVLAALPTRDALLPILADLSAAAAQDFRLPALGNQLPARFGRAFAR